MKADRGSAISAKPRFRPAAVGDDETSPFRYWSPECARHPLSRLWVARMRIKLGVSFDRRIDQQRFNLFRRCVLHVRKNMRIDIECERYAGMSQLLADYLWRDPSNQ